jgi:hypothetical protein
LSVACEDYVIEVEWRPISTAPRERRLLLYVPATDQQDSWIGVGHFELSPESPADEGYWKAENPQVSATRATHWLPLPGRPGGDSAAEMGTINGKA